MPPESLVNVLEAALLAAGRALTLDDLIALFVGSADAPDRKQLREGLVQLEESLSDRGIELVEVASGYRLQVRKEYSSWLAGLFSERPPRYSRALLETLALITYRQPITRGEIEEVRGVAVSSNIIKTLMEREWIRVLGHREVPGRPALYGTTREFLDHFGLKNLEGLPPLAEIRDLDQVAPDLFAPAATDANDEQQSSEQSTDDSDGEVSADQQNQDQASADETGVDLTSDEPSANEIESDDLEVDDAVASVELGAEVAETETDIDADTGDEAPPVAAQSNDANIVDEGDDGEALSDMDADDDPDDGALEADSESELDEDESAVTGQSADLEQTDGSTREDGSGNDHIDSGIHSDSAGSEAQSEEAPNDGGENSLSSRRDGELADEHEKQDASVNEQSDESERGELDGRR